MTFLFTLPGEPKIMAPEDPILLELKTIRESIQSYIKDSSESESFGKPMIGRVQDAPDKVDQEMVSEEIKALREETKRNTDLSEKAKSKQVRIFNKLETLATEQTKLLTKESDDRKLGKKKEIEDIVKSLKSKESKRGFGERFFDSFKKSQGGLTGLLTSSVSASFGLVSDKIVGGLKETVGLPLQHLGIIQGEKFEELNAGFMERDKLRLEQTEKINSVRLQEHREKLESRGKSSEEIETLIEAMRQQQEKRIRRDFDVETRMDRVPTNALNVRGLAKRSAPTYTDEEKEDDAESQSAAAKTADSNSDRLYNLFLSISDPKTSTALDVRIVDSKVNMGSSGAIDDKKVPDGEGLLSKLGSGIKGIFKSIGKYAPMFVGAMKAASVPLLAVGAAGGAIYTAIDSYKTITEVNELEASRMKRESKTRTIALELDKKRAETLGITVKEMRNIPRGFEKMMKDGLTDESGNKLSVDELKEKRAIAERQSSNKLTDIGVLQDKIKARESSSWISNLTDRVMGQEKRSTSAIQKELDARLKERSEIQGSIGAIDLSIREQSIKSVTPSKMAGTSIGSQQTEVVDELKKMSDMLEKVYTDSTKEIQTARTSQIDSAINAMASKGQLTQSSTSFARPATDTANTQGVIKS